MLHVVIKSMVNTFDTASTYFDDILLHNCNLATSNYFNALVVVL